MGIDKRLTEIQRYFDERTPMILDVNGVTYQYGTLIEHNGDPIRETSLLAAERLGVRPGMRLLDAGCGAGGPAVDIAESVDDITIDAITISPVQAAKAQQYAAARGLAARVRVHTGDYHHLPFADETFDGVYFLESACYSTDKHALFLEALRVLKPGGAVYMKEPFAEGGRLTSQERDALAKANDVWVVQIDTLGHTVTALESAGFWKIRTDGWGRFDLAQYYKGMFKASKEGPASTGSESQLTEYGKAHLYEYSHNMGAVTPAHFGEVWAERPNKELTS